MSARIAETPSSAASPLPAYQQALRFSLDLAVARHRAGVLNEAEQLYRDILQIEPKNAPGNHNLGVLLMQTGRVSEGIGFIETALTIKPESECYWVSYVEALALDGQGALARERLEFARRHGMDAMLADRLCAGLAEVSSADPCDGGAQ